uniref:40S ribosomal protein S7 n=1 Tax=Steinernema glaseri TaxID=37863 RepID=A0A1I8A5E3_9BILA
MPETAHRKLVKPAGKAVEEIEKTVANALADLENNDELKKQLRDLYIVGAKELDFGDKKCIIVYVPVPQLREFQKIQPRLVRELEKKFSGRYVVFVAKRRILPKPLRGKNRQPEKQKRPRSRTLTSVHDAILADLVYPAEVVGRRTRVKLDGKKIIKVHLDKTQQTNVEHKVDTFSSVYKQLTKKDVVFEFPEPLF